MARTSGGDALAALGRPTQHPQRPLGEDGAAFLVVARRRVVDGVVEERGDRHGAAVVVGPGAVDHRRFELADVAQHPHDVAHAVVPTVGLTVATDHLVEPLVGPPSRRDDLGPRRAELDLVAHGCTMMRATSASE